MISQRSVQATGFGAVRARTRIAPSNSRKVYAFPAIAGRKYISALIGASVLARLMLVMCLAAFSLMLYLAQASQESVLQFNIAELQQRQAQLNAQQANLSSQATHLQSFGRIDTIATGQLHLVKPAMNTTVWVEPLIPPMQSTPDPGISLQSAEQASQPLAWMDGFVSLVKSSF